MSFLSKGSPPVRRTLETPRSNKDICDANNLLECQDFGFRKKLVSLAERLCRHTKWTSKITSVCDRDSKVVERSAEFIFEFGHGALMMFYLHVCSCLVRDFQSFEKFRKSHRLARTSIYYCFALRSRVYFDAPHLSKKLHEAIDTFLVRSFKR